MSIPKSPKSAKLVIGIFLREKGLFEPLVKKLSEQFGDIDLISSWFPFNYTNYYEVEMGAPLFRRVTAFKKLIRQNDLSKIKNATNDLEVKYSTNGKRKVNIDPGYMLHERFVLATGKNFTHRIYVDKGIYADLTLIYTKGGFQKLPWTYPDYVEKNMLDYLELVRNKYIADLKQGSFSVNDSCREKHNEYDQ